MDYDYTVRDSEGNIVQFKFGGDSIDPAKYYHGEFTNFDNLIGDIKRQVGMKSGKVSADKVKKRVKAEGLPDILANKIIEAGIDGKTAEIVIKRAKEELKRSYIQPAQPVGILAAESVAEPATQMTLRTFHTPGVAETNVTLGLPRLIELFDARKRIKTPLTTIYLEKPYSEDKEKAEELANTIVELTVGHLMKELKIDYGGMRLIFITNPKMFRANNIKTEKIVQILSKYGKANVKGDVIILTPKVKSFKDLKKVSVKISSIQIKGIKGIKKAVVRRRNNEYIIEAEGVNLKKISETKGVDKRRTRCNDIHETLKVLGVEAARKLLLDEISQVLERQGLEVDKRHISLIADLMTFKGDIRQTGRYGIIKEKRDVLARSAFETTKKVILKAAKEGLSEDLNSPLDCVIVGYPPPVGTGVVELYWKLGG